MARVGLGHAPPHQCVTSVFGGMNGLDDKGRRGRKEGRFLADAAEKVSAHAVAMPTTQSHANTAQAGGRSHVQGPAGLT